MTITSNSFIVLIFIFCINRYYIFIRMSRRRNIRRYPTDYDVGIFSIQNERKMEMKHNMKLNSDTIQYIQDMIQLEKWDEIDLKHYINYTFQVRYYDNDIRIYTFREGGHSFGIFCLNLFKRDDVDDKYPLYLIFKNNPDYEYNPGNHPTLPWIVARDCCMTRNEIMSQYRIKKMHIPVFNGYLTKYEIDHNGILQNLHWRYAFNRNVINRTWLWTLFRDNGINYSKFETKRELIKPFKDALERTVFKDKRDGGYIVPSLLFARNKQRYEIGFQILLRIIKNGQVMVMSVAVDQNYRYRRLYAFELAVKQARLLNKLPKIWQESFDPIPPTPSEIAFSSPNSLQSSYNDNIGTFGSQTFDNYDMQLNNDSLAALPPLPQCIPNSIIINEMITDIRFKDVFVVQNMCLQNDKILERVTRIDRETTNFPFTLEYSTDIKEYNIHQCSANLLAFLSEYKHIWVHSSWQICTLNLVESTHKAAQVVVSNEGILLHFTDTIAFNII